MGALHAGHQSLIRRSAQENEVTVVSVFVNPTQFGDTADLDLYPRDLERDTAVAAEAGASIIFAPTVASIYPPGFDSWVEVGEVASRWEGASRPGHFRGVATVVTILMNAVVPARTYFGEKDFQQLQVIRRLHTDLGLPGKIVGCETIRDADGLAFSSRNARLAPGDRQKAGAIPQAIAAVIQAAEVGELRSAQLEAIGRSILAVPGISVDYLAIVDEETLRPVPLVEGGARLLLAAEIGGVRLIDNARITVENCRPPG